MYIHQQKAWPHFYYKQEDIQHALIKVRKLQRRLQDKVRTFSVTHFAESTQDKKKEEGMEAMVMDAVVNCFQPVTARRMFNWHAGLFPAGISDGYKITVANWRKDVEGPMEVVSETNGKERVNFQAPPASTIPAEMQKFITWFNADDEQTDLILKAAIAHLWFVTIHPFDDGNGRIARVLTEMMLARSDKSTPLFYSMSSQLHLTRKTYCEILERTQKGNLDITEWLQWFLNGLHQSLNTKEANALFVDNHFSP